jgi:hypothetical protein
VDREGVLMRDYQTATGVMTATAKPIWAAQSSALAIIWQMPSSGGLEDSIPQCWNTFKPPCAHLSGRWLWA